MNFNNPVAPSAVGHFSSGQTPSSNYWSSQPGLLATSLNNQPSHRQSNTLAYFHNPHSLRATTSSQLLGQMQNHVSASSTLPELKKHKRTRSGCFTCRSRRVKCDETRPICGRCSKGKRECVYPPPQVSKKGSRSNIKSNERFPSITESGSEDDIKGTASDPYKRPKMPGRRISQNQSQGIKQGTVGPRGRFARSFSENRTHPISDSISFSIQGKSPSSSSDMTVLSADSCSPGSSSTNTVDTVLENSSSLTYPHLPDASGLKDDIQFFLSYRTQHISYRHYMFKSHATKFVNEDIMRLALEYEPLLYAVVTFAAYIYSVNHPSGKLYTFLKYYDNSVTLLLKSLRSGEAHHDAMLLTVLQLATFEEYVGDWANLVDHHQGAHRMLLDLYTPESINEDDFHHHILIWYTRFDAMSAMMGGSVVVLSRDWYVEAERSTMLDAANNPDDLSKKIKAFTAQQKLFAMDFSSLREKTSQRLITQEEFTAEHKMIQESFDALTQYLELMKDPRYAITSFPSQQALGPDDIVDPYTPGLILGGAYYEVNLCHLEYLNYAAVLKYQMGMIQQQLDISDLQNAILYICQIIEALDRQPEAPKDLPIMHQNSLGLVCVFVPHDERHWHWSRRKLAAVERTGYLYPPSFRRRMAGLWKKPELTTDWWIEDEEPPKLMQEIRGWIQERTMSARDPFREAVREVQAIFGRVNIDDYSSPSAMSSPSTYAEKSPVYASP